MGGQDERDCVPDQLCLALSGNPAQEIHRVANTERRSASLDRLSISITP